MGHAGGHQDAGRSGGRGAADQRHHPAAAGTGAQAVPAEQVPGTD